MILTQYLAQVEEFASKWYISFENPNSMPNDFLCHEFEDECMALGFCDCGHVIGEKCGKASCDVNALKDIIEEIDDMEFLGSMIYSNWLYFYHWACFPEKIMYHKNRNWFLCALDRIWHLCKDGKVHNKVPVRKIEITSTAYEYRMTSNDEFKQKLTVNDQGRCWLQKYAEDQETREEIRLSSESFTIDKESAKKILSIVDKNMRGRMDILDAEYMNKTWELVLVDVDDNIDVSFGSASKVILKNGSEISDYIRMLLDRPDLILFDAEPIKEWIDNITLEYNRNMQNVDENYNKFTFKDIKECLVQHKRHECLEIDRKEGYIKYINSIDSKTIDYILKDRDEIGVLLGFFSNHGLFKVAYEFFQRKKQKECKFEENGTEYNNVLQYKICEEKSLNEFYDEKSFILTVKYRNGSLKKFYGDFNRNNLPFDYGNFIDHLKNIMTVEKKGDIFNPRVYKRGNALDGEYIYCSVTFQKGEKSYYYIADSEELNIGDFVDVPVGKEGKVSVGKIVDMDFYTEIEAPLAVEKTKHIIGKHEKSDFCN